MSSGKCLLGCLVWLVALFFIFYGLWVWMGPVVVILALAVIGIVALIVSVIRKA